MKVVGFDHVVVNSTDIERSIRWYCGELGLEPVRVDEWRRGEVLFPSARVNAETIIDLFPAERTGENVNHFCLVIEPTDLTSLAKRFPDGRLAEGLFGAQGFATSLYVQDPDGNTVELRCYGSADAAEPGMAQRGSRRKSADAAEPGMAQRGSRRKSADTAEPGMAQRGSGIE